MNNIGYSTGVRATGTKPMANVPDISQISCLGTQTEQENSSIANDGATRRTDDSGDWFKTLSENSDQNQQQRSNIRDTDSDFVKLSKRGGHEGLLRMEGDNRSPFKKEIFAADRVSPSKCAPAGIPHIESNVAPGNPIWLGGSGPERGFVPGKRFLKQEHKESPFALSCDYDRTQSRNPDKI